MNLAHLLARAARVFPERIALARGVQPITNYAQLGARAATLAAGFHDTLGLAPGDRVALFMKNCPEYLEVLLAAWWAGLAAVPVNAKLHTKELEFILEDSGASYCFATPEHANAVAGLIGDRAIDAMGPRYARLAGGCAQLEIHASQPEDTAWLFYTSGTTGRPKGVMLTHRNLLAMTLCYFSDVDSIGPADCIIHAAPMSHGSGLYALPHLAAAVTNIVPDSGGFEPAEIFGLSEHWSGVALFAAPTMVKRLVEHARDARPKLDGIKSILYGGGPMYLADIKDALAVMGNRFAQIYGQGESPMTITALSKFHLANRTHPRYEERLSSVGVAQSGVEVRVVDDEDRALSPGEVGEITVRGDVVMRGYWRNPAASESALHAGWLHTGDLGVFDEDGFLTLKDRSKDLIISGGSNIYPREVEEVLLLHPAVSEVSVVGRTHPEWGEEVVAFIVCRSEVGSEALDALCLDHIARFKRPKHYRFVESLPKNHYGKVLKTELRRQLDEGAPPSDRR